MSAHDQIRAMLDQLMGTGRDGENNKYKVKFDDPRVCKSFLLGCCPHDILASTRMDLGECPKIHDLALKADYEAASKHKDYYYDIDAMEHLANFIADCDRRTELAKRRLKETQEELSEEATGKAETIHQLGEEIGTKLAKAEQVGADGHVDESMNLMQEIEDLKKQKASAEIEYRNSMPASSYQQQKLRVCDVCSAYLGIHDNDRRLADHFGGKLHLGFITIRDKLEELKKSVQDRRHQREIAREDRKRERELEQQQQQEAASEARSRSRSREKQRERSKSRERGGGGDRERDREREREQRSSRSRRSRSRSRDRRRRRSRSGERSSRRHRSRSRSRDRDRHARSRRSRSRSRSKRSRRSRSRSHSRRSRSGSRRSRRSRSRSASRRSYSKHRSRSGSKEKTHDSSNSKPREEEEEHRNGDGEAEHHNSRESPERQ